MFRREFLSFAAGGVAAAPQTTASRSISEIIDELQAAIAAEIPDATLVQVQFQPENVRMPLTIQVFRI